MDKKEIIKKINDAVVQLEGVPAYNHDAKKRMVIAVEMLIQAMQELNKEEGDTDGETAEGK